MKEKKIDYPYEQKGARKAPDKRELRIFAQTALHEGGATEMSATAQKFAGRFAATVSHYPRQRELPNWLRAQIEKKVPVEELAKTFNERLQRAPSEENMELALIVANEISRMDGGSKALARYLTPTLFKRLQGKGDKER